VIADQPQFLVQAAELGALAEEHQLASIGSLELAASGGLMAYGVRFSEVFRRGAAFVDKILKGENPGNIPIEQPTKFKTVVNLKTAKALGLTIPPTLLATADEVIE
jgi:putative ABC transport system substrate-binding protein